MQMAVETGLRYTLNVFKLPDNVHTYCFRFVFVLNLN